VWLYRVEFLHSLGQNENLPRSGSCQLPPAADIPRLRASGSEGVLSERKEPRVAWDFYFALRQIAALHYVQSLSCSPSSEGRDFRATNSDGVLKGGAHDYTK
jgi:hypothetical protein